MNTVVGLYMYKHVYLLLNELVKFIGFVHLSLLPVHVTEITQSGRYCWTGGRREKQHTMLCIYMCANSLYNVMNMHEHAQYTWHCT